MMSFKEVILTVLSAAVVNNLVFSHFLGISFCSGREREKYLGPAVAGIIFISGIICAPVSAVLKAHALEAFETFAFVIIILALCLIAQAILGKRLQLSFPLIALNSAVLGLAVNNAAASLSFIEALLSSLGAGLGFWLALILMSSLQLKLNNPEVPRPFRGFPIELLAAGIISMALFAF